MDTAYKQWVDGYAKCVISNVFGKLALFIERDVEAAKRKSPFREEGFEFKVEPDPITERTKKITVTRYPPRNSSLEKVIVTFTREEVAILVECSLNGFTRWAVKWNHETVECDLLRDSQAPPDRASYALWQISYYALAPLFFPKEILDSQA